jgi:hypothetical protein
MASTSSQTAGTANSVCAEVAWCNFNSSKAEGQSSLLFRYVGTLALVWRSQCPLDTELSWYVYLLHHAGSGDEVEDCVADWGKVRGSKANGKL